MEPTKIYISGKITGLPINDARHFFREGEIKAKKLNLISPAETVNPMTIPHPRAHALEEAHASEEEIWNAYMEGCIAALLTCDAIYMLKNWGDSKGARVEYAIAKELGLTIHYEE